MFKLNLGCGFNKLPGYFNVDRFDSCAPDAVFDLEETQWPWPSDAASEVVFNHSLEHMGQSSRVFLRMMQELYRVCAPEALIRINVPHPRHDNFIDDATHVRVITPALMSQFDRMLNYSWVDGGHANSTMGLYLDVDFVTLKVTAQPARQYLDLLDKKLITSSELSTLAKEQNNVIEEYYIELTARKPLYRR